MFVKLFRYISWTAFAQFLNVVSLPLLAFVYEPESFGLLGLYTSYCAVSSALIALRFEYAISSANNEDLESLLGLVFFLSLIFFLPVLFIFYLFTDGLVISLCLALASIFIAFYNAYQAYFVRKGLVNKASSMLVFRVIIMLLIQFAFSKYEMGLFIGFFFSYIITVFIFSNYIEFYFSSRELKYTFDKYISFLKFNFPHTLLNVLGNNLPYSIIEKIYGVEALGYFTMAMKVVQIPHRLISNALRQVISSQFTSSDIKETMKYYRKSTLALLIVSIVIFFPLYLSAGLIFTMFLGEQWTGAGEIVSLLCIWFAFSLCNVPSISLLTVHNKLLRLFIYELISFLFRITLFYSAFSVSLIFDDFILYFSLIGVFFNFFVIVEAYFYLFKRKTGKHLL
tara:strand:- start:2864 stop:4051 length:1188 start_codon:yes stop_codon:yes gene_type:complete